MKRTITLTTEEFRAHMRKVIAEAMNEIDGKIHSRVFNATTRASELIQKGIYDTSIKNNPNRVINHDDVLGTDPGTEERANKSLIGSHGNMTFLFFAKDRLGLTTHLTFAPCDITKLEDNIGILRGEIAYKYKLFNGKIMIDFTTNRVYYIEPKTRHKFLLEVDNRVKDMWDAFSKQLKISLDNRI